MIVPIRGLFEAHLTVSDLDRSIRFYRDVLGLPLAQQIPERNVAFFWVPTSDAAMLGLWSIGTSPLQMRLHIAFSVELEQVLASVGRLRDAGLTPLDGGGKLGSYSAYSLIGADFALKNGQPGANVLANQKAWMAGLESGCWERIASARF